MKYFIIAILMWYLGSWFSVYMLTVNISELKNGRRFAGLVPILSILLVRAILNDKTEPMKNRIKYFIKFIKTKHKYLLVLYVYTKTYQENLAKHPQKSISIERNARIAARKSVYAESNKYLPILSHS